MERNDLYYKDKKSTTAYAEFDNEFFYLANYEIRIPWESIKSIELTHLRPEEKIIEITTTPYIDLKENSSLLNWIRLYFVKVSSNYSFQLNSSKANEDFQEFYEKIKLVNEAKKNYINQETEEEQTKFYIATKNYLFWGVFYNFLFMLLAILSLTSYEEGDLFMLIFWLVYGSIFLYRVIKYFLTYRENIKKPCIEVTKDALICEFGKVIIPWNEIIGIEPYSDKLEIKTTLKITNNLKQSFGQNLFRKLKKPKTYFVIEIPNYKVNSEKYIYRIITTALSRHKSDFNRLE